MKKFFCKLAAPWRAERFFEDNDDFYDFLLRRDRHLNTIRVILFLIAAVSLMLGYAFEPQPYNAVAVGALVVALGLSVVIIQNEKQLPPDLRPE